MNAKILMFWGNKTSSAQRNSVSATHMEEGLGPPAHSPDAPSGYIYASGRIRNLQQTYVKRAVH